MSGEQICKLVEVQVDEVGAEWLELHGTYSVSSLHHSLVLLLPQSPVCHNAVESLQTEP